jgi:alcohol dehydrogenase class IV
MAVEVKIVLRGRNVRVGGFVPPPDVVGRGGGVGCGMEVLKTLSGKKAIIVVGGGSMKRFGFLDKAVNYLKEAGLEVQLFENVEPDPSVETVMRGAEAMKEFEPDWIISMGGGSPIDAAKAMWAFYEYPETTFEDLCIPFNFPTLRQKAKF